MASTRLAHITGPTFVVGVEIEHGHASKVAPLVRYMLGWSEGKIIAYCKRRKWRFEIV